MSESGLRVSYEGTENGMKMSDLNGAGYDAKFDGKDYPVQGDPGHSMVSLKRIGDDTIEETYKRNGKVVGISRLTISKDGKSISVDFSDKERNTTTKYKLDKQS